MSEEIPELPSDLSMSGLSSPPPVMIELPVEEVPVASIVARAILDAVNAQPAIRAKSLRGTWETLWENDRPGASPQEIFDALQAIKPGSGQIVLLAGSLAVQDLENIANATQKTFAEVAGDQKYYTTPIPIVLNQDGSVTVQNN